MLREVKRPFDIGNGVRVQPGDVVDVSNWKNAAALERVGYIGPTKALKPTISHEVKEAEKPKEEASAPPPIVGPRLRSRPYKSAALGSRPRVFSRKAKQGD